jgi:myo-inositol-1(or 4)-monophosphatase
VTPWLNLCREAAGDIHGVLAELPTRLEREQELGTGMGGDETTAIDAAAEKAVVGRLEALHATGVEFVLVSEELGERRFGENPRWYVVVDPIDGSVNAKRVIPFFSLSIAVASGPSMRDVEFGYVHDFGSREEWVAEKGAGAALDGRSIAGAGPKTEIEILSFEATMTTFVAEKSAAFLELAPRMRIMGSLALSLCHLAAGRVDAVVSLKPIRSVDIAAGQLLVREQGLSITLPDVASSFDEAPLDVTSRSRIVAGATAAVCERLAAALRA